MKALAGALLAFQKEAPNLQKNAINPHFKNKYISLDSLMEQVLPALNKQGVALIQAPTTIDGHAGLRTTLVHAESGEHVEDVMPLMLEKANPQGQGSAITYARRYALMAILGLVADEDDDANVASPEPKTVTNTTAETPAETFARDGNHITEKQLAFLRKLIGKFPSDVAHALHNDCVKQYGYDIEGLSKKEATEFIDKVKRFGENAAAAEDPDSDVPF